MTVQGLLSNRAMLATLAALTLAGAGGTAAANLSGPASGQELAMYCDPYNPGSYRTCEDTENPDRGL